MNENEVKICAWCHKKFYGWGNNGLPLIDGIVCNECNNIVITERIRRIMMGE